MMKETLAIIGGLIAVLSAIPYLLDIIRRKTKPNIVTWLTWTALTGIATAAAFAAGEPRTAFLTLGATVATLAVVVLGIKYGITKFSLFDILCQIGAVIGLLCWLLFNSPDIGIIVPVVIDFVAMLPTLRHAWQQPGEETWQTFLAAVAASVFTIISLTRYNLASLLYPVYLLLANGTLTVAILLARKYSRKNMTAATVPRRSLKSKPPRW